MEIGNQKMTLSECRDVLEHWAKIFDRELYDRDFFEWHKIFKMFTAEQFRDAFSTYYSGASKHYWPMPKYIREQMGAGRIDMSAIMCRDSGQYIRRNGESDVELMERSCGPDWREKAERGIAGLRKMGIPYGGKILLSAEYWRGLGVRLPEDGEQATTALASMMAPEPKPEPEW